MPKKDLVQDAGQMMLNVMDSLETISNVSDAGDAGSDLFGNALMSKSVMGFPGSNCGFKKVIPLGGSPSSPATAFPRSNKSRITGSINRLNKAPISLPCGTSFMTAPTSAEATALSLS